MSLKPEICSIYKSSKKDEMYLYVRKANGLSQVPEALLAMFGKATLFGSMLITADKKLARADATQVLTDIAEKGFYLQMPPPREDYMLDLFRPDESKYQ
ncbi:MAG: YcgL domain-containing protein [Moraxellaceae bacterium]|nr:YcgL domain-containing protein [Pseudomonadales bacterium]MCB1673760.1 YcgL domain-containing protein [Pseudomonadales bacterium]MCP5174859.1 YcgL domain-containing protein [Moraxellaceae bacterium]MCP5178151.1 YcgL domain-containing protein [Moraxellaceae bacterium]